jgi:hypothetical protein
LPRCVSRLWGWFRWMLGGRSGAVLCVPPAPALDLGAGGRRSVDVAWAPDCRSSTPRSAAWGVVPASVRALVWLVLPSQTSVWRVRGAEGAGVGGVKGGWSGWARGGALNPAHRAWRGGFLRGSSRGIRGSGGAYAAVLLCYGERNRARTDAVSGVVGGCGNAGQRCPRELINMCTLAWPERDPACCVPPGNPPCYRRDHRLLLSTLPAYPLVLFSELGGVGRGPLLVPPTRAWRAGVGWGTACAGGGATGS